MKDLQKILLVTLICAIALLMNGVNSAQAGPGYGSYYANSPAGGVTGTALTKFVDSLPGICEVSGPNNLGQCIPLASAATLTVNGIPTDYYEIGLKEYTEKMHSNLPKATKLRGYYQINTSGTASVNHYLGPLIVATKDRPVTVKFVNSLPTGTAGNLFIPVDTSMMGAGTGPDGVNIYTQNRATLHLHGGNTPWISDGTPHQWIVPALETSTTYTKGVSQQNVPGMPDPGAGAATFFWTNQQSGRLMFYHDHAYGITRLNVYAGEAAGYLLRDPAAEDALALAGVPGTLGTNPANWDLAHLVPLVIQDKTFVPQNIAVQDSKWDTTKWGQYGDLWFPHVYEANQDPNSPDGANPFGRWDYGPWFWPPVIVDSAHSVIPEPSTTPEAFMDTPIVNGTAYPFLVVQPTAYRFQILNACNDRTLNLSLFLANPSDPTGKEVRMVAAGPNPAFPADWPTDGRTGGVPDPATVGPSMIQIGSEGGILPNPVVIPNRPIGYDYNRRNIVVLNTLYRALMLGPAERADVIVDFSGLPAGTKLILYNDGPAPNPAYDTRYDYYTGDPDQTTSGGAPSTMVGYGPNTRTIMQFQVAGAPTAAFNPAPLNTTLPALFKANQPAPIVPETVYNTVGYANPPFNDLYSKISDYSLTFYPMDASITGYTTVPATIQFQSKAIQELWDPWGRMNATLGVELPFTTNINQTTIPMGYVEPATEFVVDGQPQIWKITHNGVDTHPVHFHMFDVQVINRVGWDGAIRPPDDNELGWKETVRMNPLEDIVFAMKAVKPTVPFAVPNSNRLYDVTQPLGGTMNFTNIDPLTGNPTVTTNQTQNYGWEYVWHCHILGHEENDMMRPIIFQVPTAVPPAPALLVPTTAVQNVTLTWTEPATTPDTGLVGFLIRRNGTTIATINSTSRRTYTDTTVASNTQYSYQVIAFNGIGNSIASNVQAVTTPVWIAPTVALTAPTNGATFTGNAPVTITLTATATPNGTGVTISKVEFYNGTVLLGTSLTAPYSFTWSGVTGGVYTLTAKAYDSVGATAVSVPATVTVTVTAPATMISPVNASTLAGASQTFTWTNAGANMYQVWVGSTVGTANLGFSPQTTATTATITGLPLTGNVIYVRLWSLFGTTWTFNDYTYTAFGPAIMLTPVNTTTLTGTSQTFTWTNIGATNYQIWAGSTPGGFDYGSPGLLPSTTTSATFTTLPANVSTVYVRLWSLFGSTWSFNDFTYTSGP